MKKTLVVANWKMNPDSVEEAVTLFDEVKGGYTKIRNTNLVILPPFAYLDELHLRYKGTKIAFGVQGVAWQERGAFTGLHSVLMAKNLGAEYSLVGHSEARLRGETNEDTNKSIHALLEKKMTPILCIGEKARDAHAEYLSFLKEEIADALRGVEQKYVSKIIIAYEPLWAIGKDHTQALQPMQLHEMVILIRKIIAELYDAKTAHQVRIVYGGSVEALNIASIVKEGEVDGVLVGHASLKSDTFLELLGALEK